LFTKCIHFLCDNLYGGVNFATNPYLRSNISQVSDCMKVLYSLCMLHEKSCSAHEGVRSTSPFRGNEMGFKLMYLELHPSEQS